MKLLLKKRRTFLHEKKNKRKKTQKRNKKRKFIDDLKVNIEKKKILCRPSYVINFNFLRNRKHL